MREIGSERARESEVCVYIHVYSCCGLRSGAGFRSLPFHKGAALLSKLGPGHFRLANTGFRSIAPFSVAHGYLGLFSTYVFRCFRPCYRSAEFQLPIEMNCKQRKREQRMLASISDVSRSFFRTSVVVPLDRSCLRFEEFPIMALLFGSWFPKKGM